MGPVFFQISSPRVSSFSHTQQTYLKSLEYSLKSPEVARRRLQQFFNFGGRERRVALYQGVREEHRDLLRYFQVRERLECEVPAEDMRGRIRESKVAETALGHAVIRVRIAPTAQPAFGIRILPKGRLEKVGSIW